MSDSDCSNCNDLNCKYRIDDHYNCYKIQVDILQKVVTKKDLDYLVGLLERIEKQEEKEYRDVGIKTSIEDILFDIKEALGENE